jgi:hypothetical protein
MLSNLDGTKVSCGRAPRHSSANGNEAWRAVTALDSIFRDEWTSALGVQDRLGKPRKEDLRPFLPVVVACQHTHHKEQASCAPRHSQLFPSEIMWRVELVVGRPVATTHAAGGIEYEASIFESGRLREGPKKPSPQN